MSVVKVVMSVTVDADVRCWLVVVRNGIGCCPWPNRSGLNSVDSFKHTTCCKVAEPCFLSWRL